LLAAVTGAPHPLRVATRRTPFVAGRDRNAEGEAIGLDRGDVTSSRSR
jgi:hypothetical protein